MKLSTRYGLLLGLALLFFAPTDLHACTCKKQTDRFNKLMAKRTAAVAAGNAAKTTTLTAMVARHVKNWKPIPGCPPPVIPAAWCPPGGGGGGGSQKGRGLGLGAVGFPGDTATVRVFVRNQDPFETEIIELSLMSISPIGLVKLIDSIKTDTLAPLSEKLVGFRVCIDPAASIGDQLVVQPDVFSLSDGLFWTEMTPFSITASDVRVEASNPIATVPGSGMFTPQWKISNPGASPVTKTYTVGTLGDPRSAAQLNDTSVVYPIFSAFPVDKTATGGSITLNPGDEVLIDCDMIANEICEPYMLDCKGFFMDGGLVCCAMPNDLGIPSSPPITAVGVDIEGVPAGGGIQINYQAPGGLFFNQFLPTFPGQPLEQIADQMAIITHDQYLFQNFFPFQGVAADNFVEIFGPPGGNVFFNVLDPGLVLLPPQCEPPGLEVPQLLPGDQLLIQWRANDPPAAEYDIIMHPLSGGPPLFFLAPGQPGLIQQFVTPALPVDLYETEIVAVCDPFVPIFSQPSAPIQGEVPPCNDGLPPVGLNEVFAPTGVQLLWDPIETSIGCQLQGLRLAPTPSVSGSLNVFGAPGSPPSSAFAPYSVAAPSGFGSWQWQAVCACNIDPLNLTPPSAPSVFTIAPFREGVESSISAIELYPNPASELLTVSMEVSETSRLARVVDVLGQEKLVLMVEAAIGQFQIDVSSLETGLYFLQIEGAAAISFHVE